MTIEILRNCPQCGNTECIREKLLLIDGKLHPNSCRSNLRVDQVLKEKLKESPLEQFIDGFFCDKCGHGFIPDSSLNLDNN